jgi:hypothetical protein
LARGIISQGEAHEALAMTEIKLGRTSHSLPRRSKAKTGALLAASKQLAAS